MQTIIERFTTLKPLEVDNSFKTRNENIPDEDGNIRPFNPGRRYMVTASMDKNGSQVRAFNNTEERIYLPEIISVSPTASDWNIKKSQFWLNVHIIYLNHLTFNISFELLDYDKEIDVEGKKVKINEHTFKKYSSISPEYEHYFGRPVNLTDYWRWRYCLNSSQVANTLQIAEDKRGRNMRHYLYNREEELAAKKASNASRRKAMKLYLDCIQSEEKIEGVLRMFERGRNYEKAIAKESFIFDDLDKAEKLDILHGIHDKYPDVFIKIIEDKNLPDKTFINSLVSLKILESPIGVNIYKYGDEVLGNTIDDVVAALNANPSLKKDLKVKQSKIMELSKKSK
jgi:hypothetical protein